MNKFAQRDQQSARVEQTEATIDREVLDGIRMMDAPGDDNTSDFVQTLIDEFLREASSEVGRLHDAAERHDSQVLRAAAHRLKGSSLTMGAKRLARLCKQLEEDLDRSSDPSGWLMTALDEEVIRVREAYTAERDHS
ncbi:MAG TPA: Hpt domain-containing protein [Vicinamibacterales bacterium]|jgi:HPt (histidine-containing phosphotransfer) domain-containing protein|nr:Hpt domain-containing protein [Vicinamibacterales bacterium]